MEKLGADFFWKKRNSAQKPQKNQFSCHDTKTLYLKILQLFTSPYLLYSVSHYIKKLGSEWFWKLPSET